MRKGNQNQFIQLKAISKLTVELTNDAILPEKIPDILDLVSEIFDASTVAYFQKKKNDKVYVINSSAESRENNAQSAVLEEWQKRNSIAFKTFETEQPVFKKVNDKFTFWENIFSRNHKIDIAIPVFYEEIYHFTKSLVGVILIRKEGQEPSKEDFALFTFIQQIFKIAYEKSMLQRTFNDEIDYHTRIANLPDKNLDTIFEDFLQRIFQIMSAKFVSLWVYNELDDSAALRCYYPTTIGIKPVSFSSFDNKVLDCKKHLTGKSFANRRPMVFRDIINLEGYGNPKFAKDFNLTWFISFPIIARGKIVAALNVFPNSPEKDIQEEKLLEVNQFVSQLANVIKLSILFFEETLLLDYDDFLDIMLEFQDEKRSWDNLASLIRSKMICEACSIFLLDSNQFLQLVGSTGMEGNLPYSKIVYFPYDKSLTNFAFQQNQPFVYYPEFKEKYKDIHHSKFREILESGGKSKSIIFVNILDKSKKPIGIIRCNNKKEDPSRHIGKFTKEDIFQLVKIAQVISNIYAQAVTFKEKEIERERNLNSLHHEMLAPVDGILSHIEWLEKFYINNDSEINRKAEIKFQDIKQNSVLIDVLVTSMGRYDENELSSVTETSIPQTLVQCKFFCQEEAKNKKVEIIIEYLGIPRVEADINLMMRVFYNLIRNAIKYSDKREEKSVLRITAKDTANVVSLFFSDNGIGVIRGEEEKIFEKFVRGSNSRKVFPQGTGLGLAFCKSILSKHKGSIKVVNLAKPTIFEIRIPKTQK